MPRPLLRSLALALALAPLASADEAILIPTTTVKTATPGRIRGQITGETPTDVKIKPGGAAEQSVPVDQIASITYDGGPPSLSLAETRENGGQVAEAADLYKKAAAEASGKPFIAQAARFARARILTDSAFANPARAKEAIDELESFVQANPTSRHLGPALEALIRLQLQKGDAKAAQATLDTLKAKVPGSSDRVTVLEARLQARTGKYDEAIKKLDALIAGAQDKDSPRGREAKLEKAECLVGQKKFDEAIATVQEVIRTSPPEAAEIQALAHNTLGDCYRKANNPKAALIAFLQTDILYDKDKEQHPRALAMIEQLFREAKIDVRADETRERLKQLYPQSPYLTGGASRSAGK